MCESCGQDNASNLGMCSLCEEDKPDASMVRASASVTPPKPVRPVAATAAAAPASVSTSVVKAKDSPAASTQKSVAATYTIEEKTWTNEQCLAQYAAFEFACVTHKKGAAIASRYEAGIRARLHDTLAAVHQGMHVTLTGPAIAEKAASANRPPTTECQACQEPLTDANRIQLAACGHDTHCRDCVAGFIKAKISDDSVRATLGGTCAARS
jgi:hypothetical protein